jgi:hypothetical protein
VSRSYAAVCLDHNLAALEIGTGPRKDTAEEALEDGRREHPRCDIVIGEWSGGLITVICPGGRYYIGEETHRVEAGWLRLLALAPGEIRVAAQATRVACWDYFTAHRLRYLLGVSSTAGTTGVQVEGFRDRGDALQQQLDGLRTRLTNDLAEARDRADSTAHLIRGLQLALDQRDS